MSSVKSKSYTVSSLGTTSYSIVLDEELRIKGVYEDNKILDPTNVRWNTVVNSDETKVIWNQLKGTSGLTVTNSPTDISNTFYQTEYQKELNAASGAVLLGSADSLFYQDGVVSNNRTRNTGTGSINPQQFASPNSTKYGRENSGVLAYPIDIDVTEGTGQDHISITKFQYQRTGAANMSQPDSVFKNNIAGDGQGKYGGTVILPMPKVSDANGAEWGDSDLNIFGMAAAEGFRAATEAAKGLTSVGSFGGLQNALKGTQDVITNTAKFLGTNGAGSMAVMGSVGASSALKTFGISVSPDELLARATGKIANPNAELLFQGPILRDFGFSFLMIARSMEEGRQIRKIIKWFKQGAAPKYENQALLGTPDVFKLEYSTKKMNKFHQMALRTITVDYAPDGYWSAYEDSQPIAVVMNLQFTELKPVYDVDQNKSGDDVGY